MMVGSLQMHIHEDKTVELQSEAQQCPLDASTQMTGIGCYVSCMDDKLVAPGNYITADQYHEERLRAVVVLQTFARRWLALQEVQRLRRDRDRRLRREDFNLLYHALEKWRSEEEQQINSSLRGAERKAALCFLLETETQLIAAIGHHRIAVQNNNYDKVVRNLLDKSAAPHQWRAADGRLIEMDSEHTEHECQLTRDIVDLSDREADLMTRQVKVASLQGLRKRISTLFLQFIKTPAFNPEVAKHLKVPQNPSQLKNDMFQCRGCQRYLQSSDFSPTAGRV
ncbi:IQ and ubiquitin-like domain containing protein [Dissostichus eleginoides]|uniref:IQ and ubiquitin-like domain containing protein n=1 Tax=Dissostichus eleginoides TaxID=100907 RepID=A0AAD9F408_DISEL|nr:IQ and ubiquitin-like domain containing protein [Dissostichus eleginoides]